MGYPRLEIAESKIRLNCEYLTNFCSRQGIAIMGITKGVSALLPVVKAMLRGGIEKLGDSRMKNIRALKEAEIGVPVYLIRIPMLSELEEVVYWSEGSFNSEVDVMQALAHKAKLYNKTHKVILLVDVGDLREGILPEDVSKTVGQILDFPALELEGLGTNVGCYGGVLPSPENIRILFDLAQEIEKRYGIRLKTLSGGNTATLSLLEKSNLGQGINQLRLGEAILLGTDATNHRAVPGTSMDTMRLKAEVIEVKWKPSYPIGKIGRDAFGNIPVIEDRGEMRRAIVALGRQDCRIEGLTPVDQSMEIIGGSSDHLLLDVTRCADIGIGSLVEFKVTYAAMLSLSTSSYVEKAMV
ncbi:hypothetical protein CEB3_c30170 [Peptococcaceae bacterium CEB3]|nr:hypothetical protein CEB3_c30170 [Peptococcaceae bacterium CEB3]